MRWWRVVISKLGGRGAPKGEDTIPEIGTPRRRADERVAARLELRAKCDTWPRFRELVSGDVSQSGMFIPSQETAAVGEEVELVLGAPDGSRFELIGTVANVVDEAAALARGIPRGLGIRLTGLSESDRERMEALVANAQRTQPRPETSVPAPQAAPAAKSKPRRATTSSTGPIVGIDLGTTYTSVAAVVDRRVRILGGPDGERSLPSAISFLADDEIVVGTVARERVASDPGHTITSPKRLLGRNFEDREVQTYLGRAPYRTFAGPDQTTIIEMRGREYAMPQLVSYLFVEIRRWAELRLETEVRRAVCTVPISFDDDRIAGLRRAAELAQLELVGLIDEPSSAALANRYDKQFGGVVGVYDFGGGTFDFSIVDVSKGDFQVLATSGDTWLGGDDFDQVLAEAAANQFWRQHKVDLRTQAVEWQRLLFACENTKRELSTQTSSEILVPDVLRTADGMVDLRLTVDRDTLRRASSAIIERTLAVCQQALELCDMKRTGLSCVYLSGGTTYVSAVREALTEYFGVPIRTGVPPEHAVCLGAAIHGAQLQLRGATTLRNRS